MQILDQDDASSRHGDPSQGFAFYYSNCNRVTGVHYLEIELGVGVIFAVKVKRVDPCPGLILAGAGSARHAGLEEQSIARHAVRACFIFL